jgi:methyl-accepting chemotaxis protein
LDSPAQNETENEKCKRGCRGKPNSAGLQQSAATSMTGTEFLAGKSAEILKTLSAGQCLVELELSGTIRWANDHFAALTGYSLEELKGVDCWQLLDIEHLSPEEREKLLQTLRDGSCATESFGCRNKNQTEKWLKILFIPVRDDESNQTVCLAIATDNTARKQSYLAMDGMITALERSTAVIEFDPSGIILRGNEKFLDLMGYQLEDIVGEHHRIFARPELSASQEYLEFWASLAAGDIVPGQFERLRQDGSSVWLEASYNPIFDLQGNVIRVVKFATDITEKVRANEEIEIKAQALAAALEQAQESEQIRDEMDRTLQEMSTPVTPIWDGILLLPLVGVVDSTRTDDVMRKTLNRISENQSKVFILDISGVPMIDTAVANQLVKITKATRFMGCETIISGLSASIAHTMVDLGVDVGEVRTTSTLRDAFRIGLQQVTAFNSNGAIRREAEPQGESFRL